MDDEAGDTAVQGHVSHELQVAGIIAPGIAGEAGGSEGFRSGDVLSIDMSHGGRFADIGLGHFQGGAATGSGNPEGAHGHGSCHLDVHAVAHEHAAVFMRLRVAALHTVFADDVIDPVVIGRKEFTEGLAPVEKEFLALLAAPDDLTGQDGKPGEKVVATAGLELLRQGFGPGHLLCFVTIRQDILDAMLPYHSSGRLAVHVHILAEIIHPGLLVQFVHLKTRGFRRCGMVLFARQGSPEPVYAPMSCRNLPGQDAVLDERGQVNSLVHRGIALRRRMVQQVMRRSKASLFLGMVHLGHGMEYPLMDRRALGGFPTKTQRSVEPVTLRIGNLETEKAGRRHGYVEGLLRHTTGRNPADFPPSDAVIAAFQVIVVGGRDCGPLVPDFTAHQRHSPYRHRFREGILDPGMGSGSVFRQC